MCQALWSFSLIPTPHQTRGMNFSVCKGSIVPRYGSVVTSPSPAFPPAVTPSTCCQVALEESSEWFPAPGDIKAGPLPVPILLTECTTGRYQWSQVFRSLDKLGRILVRGRGAPWPGWGRGKLEQHPAVWPSTQALEASMKIPVGEGHHHTPDTLRGFPKASLLPWVIISILYNNQATILRSCQR